MGVRETFTGSARVRQVVETIVKSGCIDFSLGSNGRIVFEVNNWRLPDELCDLMSHMVKEGTSALLEMTVQGYALSEGLKVVTLNQLDAEALENTSLNFLVGDYNQPFPTLYVDLPESFFQKHEVDCPQVGEIYAGESIPGRHYPHTVGLIHVRTEKFGYIIAAVYFTSHQAFTVLIDASIPDDTIEDVISLAFDPKQMLKNSKFISPEEEAVTLAALRVALNTVLILESEGMRKLGPGNPKYYNRLEENLRKARKRRDPEEKIQKAEQVLLAEPVFYAFDQHVIIYQHEENHTNGDMPHEHTGRSLRPHWRSGYHRTQHYGIRNLERKRIRIPPVLVNKHKFLGRPQDTSVTLDIRK
jgi:hypothetical protein